MIALEAYEAGMAAGLADAYNRVVRGVPHCHPVSEEAFAEAVAATVGEGGDRGRLHSEAAFVAKEDGAIWGFIHLAVERPKEPEQPEQGCIPFLWYERGRRQAGQALLDAAHEYFAQRALPSATAFFQDYRYPFYHLDHAYLSDRLDHVMALLCLNGYRKYCGEVYLDWPAFEPPEPAPTEVAHEIEVRHEPSGARLADVAVIARQDGERIGICCCNSCGHFSSADAAQDWFLVDWLHVDEKWRGRGLGKHVLQRALAECHAIGYRNAAISTNWENWRAFVFYSNIGFRVFDWTYGFARELAKG